MSSNRTERIQNAIRHIKLSADIDPWAMEIAVEALEKQILKKPVMGYAYPPKLREIMIRNGDIKKAESETECCPECGKPLEISQFVKTQSGLRVGAPYCKRCGQAIDWEEET